MSTRRSCRKSRSLTRCNHGRPSCNGSVFLYRDRRNGTQTGIENESEYAVEVAGVLLKIEARMAAHKQSMQKVFGWRSVIPCLLKSGVPDRLLEILAKKIYTQSYMNVYEVCPPSGWHV